MTSRKKSGKLFACVAAGVLFAIVGLAVVVGTSNSIAGRSQEADMAWEHVENEYERRVNLTTNLLGIISTEADFDKTVLTEIARACAVVRALDIDQGHAPDDLETLSRFEKEQEQFASVLRRFLDEIERHSEPKAATLDNLLERLKNTSGQIQVEIVGFNAAVRRYNTTITTFPGALLARISGYRIKPLLAASTRASLPVATDLNVRTGATMPTQP